MPGFLRTILFPLLLFASVCFTRAPLSYVPEPDGIYSAPKSDDTVTLLDVVRSRSDLSKLAEVIEQPAGRYFLTGKYTLFFFATQFLTDKI